MKKTYLLVCLQLATIAVNAQTLVASYPFNGNANDESGNGNNGVVNGANLTDDRFGNANSAYSFNGTNNWIQVPNSASLQLGTGAYTLSAWIKPNGYYSGACQANFILSKGDNGSGEGHYNLQYGDFLDGSCGAYSPLLENFATSFRKGASDNAAFTATPTTPVLGNWCQVVGTYDGTSLRLYVNGKLISTNITSGTLGVLNTADLFIGRHDAGSSNPYLVNGVIDDIKIYSTALNDAQIFDSYVNDLKKPGSGNGLLFNNTNSQYVSVGTGFDPAGSFSFETWVKRTSAAVTDPNSQTFMASYNSNGWSIGINQSAPADRIYFSKVNVSQVLSSSAITDTKWHHVAVTYDAALNQTIFYIDGVPDAPLTYNTGGFNSANSEYRIGGRGHGGVENNFMNGSLDEIRVWDGVVLTQTQIRDWMCKKITAAHPARASLKGYFRMDEGSGVKTGGYNLKYGTLVNTPTWQTSGAAIGDGSAHDYINATKTASISNAGGENFSATVTSGAPAAIHVYRVDTIPNTTAGVTGLGTNNRYFGVFVVNGTAPQYTAVYNYSGNPYVNAGNESTLQLYKRNDNSVISWLNASAVLNTTAKTLTATGQNTEYILGSTGSPLPVTLLNFDAVKKNTVVSLNWTTTSAINLSYFDIERSTNSTDFIKIATVTANTNFASAAYYIDDSRPFAGINYYRLKSTDKDGQFSYSNIVKVDFSKKYTISIVPNPAHDFIQVSGANQFKQLQLLDASGKTARQFVKTINNRYSVAGLSKGIYLLLLIAGDERQTQKIIIE